MSFQIKKYFTQIYQKIKQKHLESLQELQISFRQKQYQTKRQLKLQLQKNIKTFLPNNIPNKRVITNSKSNILLQQPKEIAIKHEVHSSVGSIKNSQKYVTLMKKKQILLNKLGKIDIQLKHCIQENQRPKLKKYQSKKTIVQNQQGMHKKASNLIEKMNKQREQFMSRRKKSASNFNKNIRQSIQIYKNQEMSIQKMKQQKKIQILKRIEERKKALMIRNKIHKQSNFLAKQVISRNQRQNQQIYSQEKIQKYSQLHCDKQKQIDQMNPQNQKKSFPKSPFLQKILKYDEIKKKQEYYKSLQRKRVVLRHKEYSEKMRTKMRVKTQNSMLIT